MQAALETFFTPDEDAHSLKLDELNEYREGLLTVTASLGIDVSRDSIFSDELSFEEPASQIIQLALFQQEIRDAIENAYGGHYSFAFELAQLLSLTRILSSFSRGMNLKRAPKKRRLLLRKERDRSNSCMQKIGEFIAASEDTIRHIFGADFAFSLVELAKAINSGKTTLLWAAGIYTATESLINQLVPHYPDIAERLKRRRELVNELSNCEAGIASWKAYEDVCLKILRYSFLPPFKEVKIQARSSGNLERRDAILPNNQYSGFWHLIRTEFESKHVVCEFKNGLLNSKNALNQLRIYLSKPTIGRFGLLFVRDSPSKSLIQAQRDAYEQSKIMIIILDDQKVTRLLTARAFLGSADDFLNNEKVTFEVNY
ncbi:MAG: hypothetical protein QOH70_1214 [Blastocatellia bacterium]|nr:hypothetical protein [Blastocatellia bacterium]